MVKQHLATALLLSAITASVAYTPAQAQSAVNYPALQPLTGLSDPTLAYGLAGATDYSTETPFLDLMKSSREWIGHFPGKWGGMSFDELKDGGYLDEHGWPMSIPESVEKITNVWANGPDEYGSASVWAGDYVLRYDGEGSLDVTGTNKVVSDGEIRFTHDGTGNWWITITQTDPNKTGNYIRNISVVKETHLPLFEAGAIFNPDWLALIKDARQIRFMDWMRTNNSNLSSWSQMTPYDNFTWTPAVPVEVQVRLANEIGADPWFNMPHKADDDFVRQFATYVRDHLDPKLRAYVELSNETWNWAFKQATDLVDEGKALWGNGQVGVYYTKRATEIMQIWDQVFGSAAEQRVVKVLATQTANLWLSEIILSGKLWQSLDPENYVPVGETFDVYAITTYFGCDVVGNDVRRAMLLAAIDDPEQDPTEFLHELCAGEVEGETDRTLPATLDTLRQQKALASNYGIGSIVAYEGGQHVHHSAFVQIPPEELQAIQDALIRFVRSDEMADLYAHLWSGWREVGDGPFMQFVDVDRPGKYGSWGVRASLVDTTPRAELLDRLNASDSAWWEDRGGAHFQQGYLVTGTDAGDTLAGSTAEDYLTGLAGDDTFYPGPGSDGVNGGSGTDTVLLQGNRAAYTVTPHKAGYQVQGPDGNDYIYAVEHLQFADQKVTVSAATTDPLPAPENLKVLGSN